MWSLVRNKVSDGRIRRSETLVQLGLTSKAVVGAEVNVQTAACKNNNRLFCCHNRFHCHLHRQKANQQPTMLDWMQLITTPCLYMRSYVRWTLHFPFSWPSAASTAKRRYGCSSHYFIIIYYTITEYIDMHWLASRPVLTATSDYNNLHESLQLSVHSISTWLTLSCYFSYYNLKIKLKKLAIIVSFLMF